MVHNSAEKGQKSGCDLWDRSLWQERRSISFALFAYLPWGHALLLQWSFFGLPASCCDILVEDCISRWLMERCTSCPLCNDCIKMLDPQMWCRRRCHISVPLTRCSEKSEQHHPISLTLATVCSRAAKPLRSWEGDTWAKGSVDVIRRHS